MIFRKVFKRKVNNKTALVIQVNRVIKKKIKERVRKKESLMSSMSSKTNNMNRFKKIWRIQRLAKELNSKGDLNDKKNKVKVKARAKTKKISKKELKLYQRDNRIP